MFACLWSFTSWISERFIWLLYPFPFLYFPKHEFNRLWSYTNKCFCMLIIANVFNIIFMWKKYFILIFPLRFLVFFRMVWIFLLSVCIRTLKINTLNFKFSLSQKEPLSDSNRSLFLRIIHVSISKIEKKVFWFVFISTQVSIQSWNVKGSASKLFAIQKKS